MSLITPKREKSKADEKVEIAKSLFGWGIIFLVVGWFVKDPQYKTWSQIASGLVITISLVILYLNREVIRSQINTDYRNEKLIQETNKLLNNVDPQTRDTLMGTMPPMVLSKKREEQSF